VDALYAIARVVVDFMNSSPGFVLMMVYLAAVGIPLILLHELGHAVAARARLGTQVDVMVGTVGKAAELHVRDINIHINAFAVPAGRGGSATFDASRVTARDMIWIALAGPAASAAGGVICALAYASVRRGFAHDVLWAATAFSVLAVATNLLPFRYRDRAGSPPIATDGHVALEALRIERGLSTHVRDAAPAIGRRREALQGWLVGVFIAAVLLALAIDISGAA
jgi:hypothetical protein